MTETQAAPVAGAKLPTPNLNKALSQLQGKLPKITKGETAEIEGKEGKRGYKYSYADLADVTQAVGPLLAEFGLAFHAGPTINPADRREMVLVWSLLHESGEEKTGEWPLGPVSTPPQTLGSRITYARRYCLGAATGIVAEDDDDGQRGQQANGSSRSAGDAWETATSERPAGRAGNGQRNGSGPQADKVAQSLIDAALRIAASPEKTAADLEGIEKQIAGRKLLDAPVGSLSGDGLVKARDVLRELRKRMGGQAEGEQGSDRARDGGGEPAAGEAGQPAQAGAGDGMAFAELDAELRSTPLEGIQAFRAKIGRAVTDRKITPDEGSALSADAIKRKRDLEEATQESPEARETVPA